MDIEMINPWTQVKSYHGHFERSQTEMSKGLRYYEGENTNEYNTNHHGSRNRL